jgi:hypothetical protein
MKISEIEAVRLTTPPHHRHPSTSLGMTRGGCSGQMPSRGAASPVQT